MMPRKGRRNQFRRRPRRGRGGIGIITRLRRPNASIVIRLAGSMLLSSNGAGVVQAVIPTDPSSSGLNNAEFTTYWVNLYGEIRLRAFQVRFLPSFEETKGAVAGQPLAIATNLNNTAGATSYATQLDNADGVIYNVLNDTSRTGYIHRFRGTILAYGPVTAPGSLTYAGCPGGISCWGSNYTVSTGVAFVQYEGFYQLRNRI